MPDSSDKMEQRYEPAIRENPDHNQADSGNPFDSDNRSGPDNQTDNLLEELFDEVNHSPSVSNEQESATLVDEPAMTAISDKQGSVDTLPDKLQYKRKPPFLLAGIILAILVTGTGYLISRPDAEQSGASAPQAQAAQEIIPDSRVLKPVPIPATPDEDTATNAIAPSPVVPTNNPMSPQPIASTTPAVDSAPQSPATQTTAKITRRNNIPAAEKIISPHSVAIHSAWAVNLMALSNHDSALKQVQRLNTKGFHAELFLINSGGRALYRIRIADIPSIKKAKKTRTLVSALPEYRHAWINHYKK